MVLDSESFEQVDGSDLEWAFFAVSHGRLCMEVNSPSRGAGKIYFMGASYIDCPTSMTKVGLRQATEAETEQTRKLLHPDRAEYLEQKDLFILDSREGHFVVLAHYICLYWCDDEEEGKQVCEEDKDLPEQLLNAVLWKGGPTFDEV